MFKINSTEPDQEGKIKKVMDVYHRNRFGGAERFTANTAPAVNMEFSDVSAWKKRETQKPVAGFSRWV